MISVFARKSLYVIAIAAISMSAFQLAGATTTTEGPTGSTYPSESAYPTDSPTGSSYPSSIEVATTISPSIGATTGEPTAATTVAPLPSVGVSLTACPADCSTIEADASDSAFLDAMAECFSPFVISSSSLTDVSPCSLCEEARRRARMLQDGSGVDLSFEFSSEDPNFTEEAAAQAFADNLDDLPGLAELLQPGLTIDPATVNVGGILVTSLTEAPTMSPTKSPKDSKKKKKGKKDKKKEDKKDKKKKKITDDFDDDDDDDDDDDMDTKTGKKGKKDKKDKKDKKKDDKKDKKDKKR
jgi:hypothetical protein